MIKNINSQNIILTPILTSTSWNLHNIDNQDVILLDTGSAEIDTIALEYIDYFNSENGNLIENSDCSIAEEQQPGDRVIFQSGIYKSGSINISNNTITDEDLNYDGTLKRLVYNQVHNAFYNSYRNPAEIFGIEYLDFGLSRTNRYITNNFLMLNVPSNIFGEKIVPSTVSLNQLTLDDNVTISDDGYGNMIAGDNLFFRIQEVRHFSNIYY